MLCELVLPMPDLIRIALRFLSIIFVTNLLYENGTFEGGRAKKVAPRVTFRVKYQANLTLQEE